MTNLEAGPHRPIHKPALVLHHSLIVITSCFVPIIKIISKTVISYKTPFVNLVYYT